MNAQPQTIGNTEGFDRFSGKRWIYPNNMPVRGYQKAAVEKALFNNTMIVLPTGLGKTFIAAVVMYNFYRWYPQGKIVFVAPTRPLVAQQIQACKKISGIPTSDCVELTGRNKSDTRHSIWETKRVFFATPQVIENDLENDSIPAKYIKCLVIDEAHRAQGSYSYVGIVRQLHERNRNGFRVLALSATPGSDIKRVQQVMLNLYIGEVMFRSENSIDLIQFKQEKTIKASTVEILGKHKSYVDKFINMTDPLIKEIYRSGVIFSKDSIDQLVPYTLVMALEKVKQNDFQNGSKGRLGYLCSAAVSLVHSFQLLTIYGIRPFYAYIMNLMEKPKSAMRAIYGQNPILDEILRDIRFTYGEYIEPNPNINPEFDLLQGHPKLFVLKDLLMKHFENNEHKSETRAIVFSKYRESVSDITQALKFYEPVLKPAVFVGQSHANKYGSAGMKQKQQIQVIEDFRNGIYNVLVATCVAEEGLDIGEIDIIICYDTTSSPISNIQRRGRTGRKRSGDVHTLLTQGYEEKKLKKASSTRRQVEEQLFNRENYMMHRYRDAPRMVPEDIIPICLEQMITPVDDVIEDVTPRKRKRAVKKDAKEKKCKDSSEKKLKKCDSESMNQTKFLTAEELACDWDDWSNDC